MVTAGTPTDRAKSPGVVLSLMKAALGLAGFSAVLLAHQLLVAPIVKQELGQPTVPESSPAVQDDSLSVEQVLEITTDDQPFDSLSEASTASQEQGLSAVSAAERIEPPEIESPPTALINNHELENAVAPVATDSPSAVTDINSDNSLSSQPELGSEESEVAVAGANTSGNTSTPSMPVDVAARVVNSNESVSSTTIANERWSAVWRPFFSPTTAQGFADYIADSTGLTLRVQQSPVIGHYLVEVLHRTEAERIDANRRIVETTGYQPPGAVK